MWFCGFVIRSRGRWGKCGWFFLEFGNWDLGFLCVCDWSLLGNKFPPSSSEFSWFGIKMLQDNRKKVKSLFRLPSIFWTMKTLWLLIILVWKFVNWYFKQIWDYPCVKFKSLFEFRVLRNVIRISNRVGVTEQCKLRLKSKWFMNAYNFISRNVFFCVYVLITELMKKGTI